MPERRAQPTCEVQLPHGHDLKVLVDRAFDRLDTNNDSDVTTQEFDALITLDDKNSTISQYSWSIASFETSNTQVYREY